MTKTLLAIETSCDETAVAVVRAEPGSRPKLVSERVASQIDIHALYGGVVPELAAREHLQSLPLLFDGVLKDAGLSRKELDGIAVTQGPGLKGCLLMGLGFAKALALALRVPVMGVNHIEGHMLAPMMDNPALSFPYLCLIVSGGHTEIQEVHGVGNYHLRARTIDDAAGEAFDKSANLLGLAYPGGAKLAALADSCEGSQFQFPRVMRDSAGFSFSGLKTSIALTIQRNRELLNDPEKKAELAFAAQAAIVDALVFKLELEMKASGIDTVALSGGVAANTALRRALGEIKGISLFCPTVSHCMDNAAMIGYVAAVRWPPEKTRDFSLDVRARWPVEEVAR